jgi:hypothetical protein
MAIRLKDGKIITKDGKVSCECCGSICIAPNGVSLSITLTGLSGWKWEQSCYRYEPTYPNEPCGNMYIGPQNLFGTLILNNGITGWITSSGEITSTDSGYVSWDSKTCQNPDPDGYYLDCQPYVGSGLIELGCSDRGTPGWGFGIIAPHLAQPNILSFGFDGQPINGNPYRVVGSGKGIEIDGHITLSWPE